MSKGINASGLMRPLALVLGGLALMAGMWGGLVRVGAASGGGLTAAQHGPLMVAGFLGTLIALERAVAFGRTLAYAAPLASGVGAALLILQGPTVAAKLLLFLGALGLAIIMFAFTQRQSTYDIWIMALGSLGLVLGNGLWLRGFSVPQSVMPWLTFLFLTVTGERLELSRILPAGSLRVYSLLTVSFILMVGSLMSIHWVEFGGRLVGLGLIGGAYWLLHYDIAWRTRRRQGLPRYMAWSVLAAASWMMVAGVMTTFWGLPGPGFRYDALLHAGFLGFGIGMVMAHAPMMVPTLVGGRARFSTLLYLPTALLHLSMVGRVGSDLMGWHEARMVSSTVNVIAILSFVAVTAFNLIGSHRE
ncbi:MAG: hypothetical protein ACLFWD_09505 [Anaerolineales bacterium]